MNCDSCNRTATPEELRGGRCLDCLSKENITLRLVIAHCIMSIESGEVAEHEGKKYYRQQYGEAFLNHLKGVLVAVKNVSLETGPVGSSGQETPSTETPAQPAT
jgi:hypothetical protein